MLCTPLASPLPHARTVSTAIKSHNAGTLRLTCNPWFLFQLVFDWVGMIGWSSFNRLIRLPRLGIDPGLKRNMHQL